MAQQGFYRDPPSRRMAFDRDGTGVFRLTPTNQLVELDQPHKDYLNSETDPGGGPNAVGNAYGSFSYGQGNAYGWIVFIFPELRNITHIMLTMIPQQYNRAMSVAVQWSNNTTNGLDGDWNSIASLSAPLTPVRPRYRDEMDTVSLPNVKAIRFYYGSMGAPASAGIGKIHIYGHKAPGVTPHRIDFAYSDGSELVQDQDYGDQPRGSDRTWNPTNGFNLGSGLYLRNRSPDKIAKDVVVSLENLSLNMIDRLSLSKDNVSYGTQITYTEIQPLQVVGPVYVRHNVESDAVMGLYASRLKIAVGEWA